MTGHACTMATATHLNHTAFVRACGRELAARFRADEHGTVGGRAIDPPCGA
jgi:hypothetical protein